MMNEEELWQWHTCSSCNTHLHLFWNNITTRCQVQRSEQPYSSNKWPLRFTSVPTRFQLISIIKPQISKQNLRSCWSELTSRRSEFSTHILHLISNQHNYPLSKAKIEQVSVSKQCLENTNLLKPSSFL